MKISMYLRNMGPQSDPDCLTECAAAAEAAGVDTLWLADHIAIPPDDAEGSGGRYLDPLATAAFLSGRTRNIRLGTAVLVLPYRPILPTAKWIATIQELSANRLRLGVGVGWMAAEFRAVGVDRSQRGRISDEYLAFLDRAFGNDLVEANGQPLLFLPRPPRPQILIGGAAPHALRRAALHGEGWMPFGGRRSELAPQIADLQRQFSARDKGFPEVVLITTLPAGAERHRELEALEAIGVTEVVHAWRYRDAREFTDAARSLMS